MRYIHFLLILFALPCALFGQYNMENLKVAASSYDRVAPAKHDNLQVYYIRASDEFLKLHSNLGNYTPLSDAIEKKKVSITETESVQVPAQSQSHSETPSRSQSSWVDNVRNLSEENSNAQVQRQDNVQPNVSGARVNTLFIENTSKDTVFIMAGELVKGGKQDRVLAQDMVLPPNSGKVDISVFCVEPHRWTADQREADGSAKFNAYGTAASANVRKAAVTEKEQTRVWEEVKVVTDKNSSTTSTGTYNAIQENAAYKGKLDGYISSLNSSAWRDPHIVGMVAVTDNRIIACDIFATHALFENSFPTLIHSYSTEAITNGAPVKYSETQVNQYLAGFLSDEKQQVQKLEGKGMLFKKGDVTLHLSAF